LSEIPRAILGSNVIFSRVLHELIGRFAVAGMLDSARRASRAKSVGELEKVWYDAGSGGFGLFLRAGDPLPPGIGSSCALHRGVERQHSRLLEVAVGWPSPELLDDLSKLVLDPVV